MAVYRGDPRSPVVLHVPHGSRCIPPSVRERIVLPDGALRAELDAMTDAETVCLAQEAASRSTITPTVVTFPWSRLVVDPERFPDDREEMRAVGMGAVYTRTHARGLLRTLAPGEEQVLLDSYYWPHAGTMDDVVQDVLDRTGCVVVVDVHSYPRDPLPYELHQERPRPSVCVGTDERHTPAWLADAALRQFGALGAQCDGPFEGCYIPNRFYGTAEPIFGVMLETRRDTYFRDGSVVPAAQRAWGEAAAALVDTVTRHLHGSGCRDV